MPAPALQQAADLARAGKRDEARQIVAQHIKSNPEDVSGWVAMARLSEAPDRALQCWQRALALRPDDERIKTEIAKLQPATLDPFDDFSAPRPASAPTAPARRLSLLWIAAPLALLLVLAAVGALLFRDRLPLAVVPTPTPAPTPTPNPCDPGEVEQYFESIHDVARRFDDAQILAMNTPRNQLAAQIAVLQEIRRDAEDLEVPDCATKAQDALIVYIDANIDSLIEFMDTDISDAEIDANFTLIRIALDQYIAAMKEWDADPGIVSQD